MPCSRRVSSVRKRAPVSCADCSGVLQRLWLVNDPCGNSAAARNYAVQAAGNSNCRALLVRNAPLRSHRAALTIPNCCPLRCTLKRSRLNLNSVFVTKTLYNKGRLIASKSHMTSRKILVTNFAFPRSMCHAQTGRRAKVCNTLRAMRGFSRCCTFVSTVTMLTNLSCTWKHFT